tara:strand:- start:15238 stop:16002 length:765 start_codon:yes stop_codon:yes gene_type:complete
MKKLYNTTTIITGATSGIGAATAKLFSKNGSKLILCGRRKKVLDEMKKKLKSEVHTLCFDVSNKDQVEKKLNSIPDSFKPINFLINNAGNAHGLDNVIDAELNDWDKMIDTNLKGLIYVTKFLIPNFIKQKKGTIINLGSIAGLEVYPKGSVYCASKHGVDAFSKGLRIDLNSLGIRVGTINPGMVNTEFSKIRFKGDLKKAKEIYRGIKPLEAIDIAETILFMITAPMHVTISDITILPTAQANSTTVNRKLI